MWAKWLRKQNGSDTTHHLLREQNDLLRLLLQQKFGIPPSQLPRRIHPDPLIPRRQTTEKDISQVTRASLFAQQTKKREEQRLASLNDVPQNASPDPTAKP